MFRIGIDLGGTKIEAIALGHDGVELARRRIAAPRDSYAATLRAIADLADSVEAIALGRVGAQRADSRGGLASGADPVDVPSPDDQPRAERRPLGIGTPGAISPATGLMKNANSTWLNGQPVLRDLEAVTRRRVRIENDANCLAISEASDGAAAGADVVFGVILGTGVGGGLVVHGRLVRGAMAIAGEWGHNRLPASSERSLQALEWPGPACYCGRLGCVETWLSGPGLLADHLRHHPQAAHRSGEDIIEAMRAGDAAASASFERYAERLARALSTVINVLDPDVIVLGGGLSRIDEIYQRVPTQWVRTVFSDAVVTRLVPAQHGDSSGVRGAAWLWPATAT